MIRFFIVLSMAQIAVAQTCANVINGHVDIPENAFKDCTSLKSITIPNSVVKNRL